MLAFLGWLTFCGMSGFDVGIILVSVIWFYSFFTVHNLVSLPDEEFYQQEDDYILIHMDRIVGIDQWERGKVKFLAAQVRLPTRLVFFIICSPSWYPAARSHPV